MSDTKAILRLLEACVQEELGSQRRTLERLVAQESALRAGEPGALDERGREIEAEIGAGLERAERRTALLHLLGAAWAVDSRTLTLASIAERSGSDGERLGRLRAELRSAAAATARQLRRNARAARTHQRAWSEVLEGVLNAATDADSPAGGRLVDAEA